MQRIVKNSKDTFWEGALLPEELPMIQYTKSVSYVWLVLLIISCSACNREARNAPAQTCTINEKPQAAAEAERPVARVVFDDKALAALTKQKATAVYCIAMGASWGGTIVDPTVIVGIPKDLSGYDTFRANEIDVYITKGINTINGTVTITAEHAFWQELFIAKGIAQWNVRGACQRDSTGC